MTWIKDIAGNYMPNTTYLSIALLTAFIASHASAQSVHSAAGVSPAMNAAYQAATVAAAPPRDFSSSSGRSTPPPLPDRALTGRQPAPIPASNTEASEPNTTQNLSAKTPPSSAAPSQASQYKSVTVDFDDAMGKEVTIDVVDMKLEDLLRQLAPTGWRVRFQNVDTSLLQQRTDMTAQSTRGNVIYEILSKSDLTLQPFDGFAEPLLLITSAK